MSSPHAWFVWALLSAIFAAAMAIIAKIGIQGVDSDLATLVRAAIVIVVLGALFAVALLGERPSLREWSGIGLIASGVLVLAMKR